jgi:hypothetical protein
MENNKDLINQFIDVNVTENELLSNGCTRA